jgi:hypothetical protein
MWLMLIYLGLSVIGNGIIYFIGLAVERAWPSASLPVYLLLFFIVLWVSWILAVKFTEPKVAAQA